MPGTGHGAGECSCAQNQGFTYGGEWLHRAIDMNQVTCGNESEEGSCRGIFRPHEDRFQEGVLSCLSDPDDDQLELLFDIPFTSPVKIYQLFAMANNATYFPSTVTIYANMPGLTFQSLQDTRCIQRIDVIQDLCGNSPHALSAAKLANVTSLQLHFCGRTGLQTQIGLDYIGLRGQISGYRRQAVTTVYEAKPNISDHEVPQRREAVWRTE